MSAATCACVEPVELNETSTRTCARCALPIADERPKVAGGVGAPPVIWGLPFACPSCRVWGYVGVCTETSRKTTDEQVMYLMGRKHREISAECMRAPEKMLMGRLRRREKPSTAYPKGRMIFMLRKGEDEHTAIDSRWPIWDVT